MAITLTYDGTDLSSYITINAITGRGVASREASSTSVPKMHGSYHRYSVIPTRYIEVEFTVAEDSITSLRDTIDDLNNVLLVNEPKALEFSDEPGKTYYGITNGADEDGEERGVHKGTVTFVCYDPFKYGLTKSERIVDANTLVESSSDENPLKIEIYANASASGYEITHEQSGKTITLNYDFQVGDTVEVYSGWDRKHKVLVNGEDRMQLLDMFSDYFELAKGENTFLIQASVDIDTDIVYRNRWA